MVSAEVSPVCLVCLGFALRSLIGWQTMRHFLNHGKTKTIVTLLHAFFRAWHRLHIIAFNSHERFAALIASRRLVITPT